MHPFSQVANVVHLFSQVANVVHPFSQERLTWCTLSVRWLTWCALSVRWLTGAPASKAQGGVRGVCSPELPKDIVVPLRLRELLEQCFEHVPGRRPTPAELVVELERIDSGSGTPPPPLPPPPPLHAVGGSSADGLSGALSCNSRPGSHFPWRVENNVPHAASKLTPVLGAGGGIGDAKEPDGVEEGVPPDHSSGKSSGSDYLHRP